MRSKRGIYWIQMCASCGNEIEGGVVKCVVKCPSSSIDVCVKRAVKRGMRKYQKRPIHMTNETYYTAKELY